MNGLAKFLLLCAVCIVAIVFTVELTFAAATPTNATCDIDCTVAGQLEWAGNFTDIDIAEELTEQNDEIVGSGTATLWTNGNVTITTVGGAPAQLTADVGTDDLVTEYQMAYDGDGASATGGATVAYDDYTTFMVGGNASAVTHFAGDGAVVLTLSVRASHDNNNVANAGVYSAIQTIVATWNP